MEFESSSLENFPESRVSQLKQEFWRVSRQDVNLKLCR